MRFLSLIALLAVPFSLATTQAHAVEVGEAAPCVILKNLAPNGGESEHCIREPKVEGQAKVLEFFSITCSTCQQNLPIVSELASSINSVATTRLVSIDRSEAQIRDYVKANSGLIHFEVALDTNRDAKRAYNVFETPTLFVLDSHDKVLLRHSGLLSAADVAMIRQLVGAK